jgi:hypothetical protein
MKCETANKLAILAIVVFMWGGAASAEGASLTLSKVKETLEEGIPGGLILVSSDEAEQLNISRFHVEKDKFVIFTHSPEVSVEVPFNRIGGVSRRPSRTAGHEQVVFSCQDDLPCIRYLAYGAGESSRLLTEVSLRGWAAVTSRSLKHLGLPIQCNNLATGLIPGGDPQNRCSR